MRRFTGNPVCGTSTNLGAPIRAQNRGFGDVNRIRMRYQACHEHVYERRSAGNAHHPHVVPSLGRSAGRRDGWAASGDTGLGDSDRAPVARRWRNDAVMTHSLGERRPFVAATAVVSIVLVIGAGILLPAAFSFDIKALAHPGSIVDKGEGVA
jgi:hypothetical protein